MEEALPIFCRPTAKLQRKPAMIARSLLALWAVLALFSFSQAAAQLEMPVPENFGRLAKTFTDWTMNAGGEATLLRPSFSSAHAMSLLASDGGTREDQIDYDFRFPQGAGYRLWLESKTPYGIGWRTSFWTLAPGNSSVELRPPNNGFGSVDHPAFGSIDIGSSVPTDRLLASASMDLLTVISEGTFYFSSEIFRSEAGVGLEFSQAKLGYHAELNNDLVGLVGRIDHRQQISGIGPTASFRTQMELSSRVALFGGMRSSIWMGRRERTLDAGEDLDLPQPFYTTHRELSDTIVTRLQGDLGVTVHLLQRARLQTDASLAMEVQNWIGVGTPSSTNGNLGLFGIGLKLATTY